MYIVVICSFVGLMLDIYIVAIMFAIFLDLLFIKQISITLVYSFVDAGRDKNMIVIHRLEASY